MNLESLVERIRVSEPTDVWQEGVAFPRIGEVLGVTWLGLNKPFPDHLACVVVKGLYWDLADRKRMRNALVRWNALSSKRKKPTPQDKGEFATEVIAAYMHSISTPEKAFQPLQSALYMARADIRAAFLEDEAVMTGIALWNVAQIGQKDWFLL